jgi:FAD/FMN-containing dehydrogenase
MRPVWLCPLRLRETGPDGTERQPRGWPTYPLKPGTTYVNVGFWGTVRIAEGRADGDLNRAIEARVTELGGHKSLYSTVHYSPEEFWRRYNGPAYQRLKGAYDPQGRLPDLYEKCVRIR